MHEMLGACSPHSHSIISWQRMATSWGTLLPSCPSLAAALGARWLGEVRVAVVFSNSDPNAVDSLCVMRFAPCLQHTPPLWTWFAPSLLYSLTLTIEIAPCLLHTPPLTDTFVHPSLLHRLALAPCPTHTPPLWARLKIRASFDAA